MYHREETKVEEKHFMEFLTTGKFSKPNSRLFYSNIYSSEILISIIRLGNYDSFCFLLTVVHRPMPILLDRCLLLSNGMFDILMR